MKQRPESGRRRSTRSVARGRQAKAAKIEGAEKIRRLRLSSNRTMSKES